MKTFFRELVLMTCLMLGALSGTQAQHVPGAIKYQAVLRDVNGKTLTNKENVNLRISLRLDDPMTGTIAYSEEHMGLATNAYGVINLEIGRGTVTSGKDLYAVPWAERDIYVQIEIETDGTGYTHMGNAELLTVPYAFYAENANNDKLYENLDNNVLPKYNAANKTLVNSGVSQQGRDLEVNASSVTFINKADANMLGYKFPMTVGRRGQVLGFTDNMGTLDWVNVEGGGGGGEFHLNMQGDGHLVYWNDNKGELDTVSALRYDYKGARKLELNTDITGNNNVLVSDKLGDGQIWVGNGFSNRLVPVKMSGAVLMDKTGNTTLNLNGHVVMTADNKTRLNLAMKGGIKLIAGKNGARDTLEVTAVSGGGGRDTIVINNGGGGGGECLWETKQNTEYNYTRLFPKTTGEIGRVYVGIGYDDPKALLHVNGLGSPSDLMTTPRALFSDCNVEFSGKPHETGHTPSFLWKPEDASLFIGAISDDFPSLVPIVGNYSIAFGLDALTHGNYSFALGARASTGPDYTFALGQNASVADGATDAFAIGNGSKVAQNAVNSMAVGYNAEVGGKNSFALGARASTVPDYTFALGQNASVADGSTDAFAIGNGSKVAQNAVNSMAVGYNAEVGGKNSVALGYNAKANGQNSVVLGFNQKAASNAVVLGYDNGKASPIQTAVVVGSGNEVNDVNGSIVLGKGNTIDNNAIVIGNNNSGLPTGSLIIGESAAKPQDREGAIVVGSAYITASTQHLVAVGNGHYYDKSAGEESSYTNLFGTELSVNETPAALTMLGDRYSSAETNIPTGEGTPIFMFGSTSIWDEREAQGLSDAKSVAFEISSLGNAFFTYDVNVEGSLNTSSGTYTSSDERLKTDIKPMLWMPSFLDSITPVSYIFKSDKQQKTRFGFIAQDVRRVFPELVRQDNKGMLSLDYIGLVPVLWQINQNLSHQVNDLEKRLEEQCRKQAELESQLQAIKEKLGM